MKKIVVVIEILAAVIMLLLSIRAMALDFTGAMSEVEKGKMAYWKSEPGFVYIPIDISCTKSQVPAGATFDKIAVGRLSPQNKLHMNWIPSYKSLISKDEWQVKP